MRHHSRWFLAFLLSLTLALACTSPEPTPTPVPPPVRQSTPTPTPVPTPVVSIAEWIASLQELPEPNVFNASSDLLNWVLQTKLPITFARISVAIDCPLDCRTSVTIGLFRYSGFLKTEWEQTTLQMLNETVLPMVGDKLTPVLSCCSVGRTNDSREQVASLSFILPLTARDVEPLTYQLTKEDITALPNVVPFAVPVSFTISVGGVKIHDGNVGNRYVTDVFSSGEAGSLPFERLHPEFNLQHSSDFSKLWTLEAYQALTLTTLEQFAAGSPIDQLLALIQGLSTGATLMDYRGVLYGLSWHYQSEAERNPGR